MEPTRQDAEARLKDAGGIESAVRARAPQEHPLYFATGLVFVLAGLLFDLGRDDSGGAAVAVMVVGVVLLAVMVATHVPYWLRYRQVRKRSTPKWLEWALAAWGAAALFVLGSLFDGTIGFAFTLGGIVGAVPSLLWAERLRRTA
jgi:NhaP-type Na+/H+ or K+/H+ antiporter